MALDHIYFHLHANTLEGHITVGNVTADGLPVAPDTSDAGLLRVPLPSPLPPGGVVNDMTFETSVPTDIGRNYGVLASFDDILAWPTSIRCWPSAMTTRAGTRPRRTFRAT